MLIFFFKRNELTYKQCLYSLLNDIAEKSKLYIKVKIGNFTNIIIVILLISLLENINNTNEIYSARNTIDSILAPTSRNSIIQIPFKCLWPDMDHKSNLPPHSLIKSIEMCLKTISNIAPVPLNNQYIHLINSLINASTKGENDNIKILIKEILSTNTIP